MEPSIISPDAIAPSRADQIAESLARQRAELEVFLTGHRERLSAAETSLSGQMQRIAGELGRVREEIRRTEDEQSARGGQLATEAATLGALRETLESLQADWRRSQEQLAERQRQWDDRVHAREETIAERLDELMRQQTHVAEAQSRLRADEERLALAQAAVEREREDLAEARRTLETQRGELETQQRGLEARQAETARQRRHVAQELRKQRAAADRDMQRMRQEVRPIAEESPMAAPRRTTAAAPPPPRGEPGWELQKQRLLAALEGMDEEGKPGERTQIKDLVRKTDEVIAAKDEEIAELKQQLERRIAGAIPTATEPIALGEGAAHDAAVEAERERLRQVQAELIERLRQGEIEVCIERAEIARQRAEVEEIMRQFAEERTAAEAARGASATEGGKLPSRRWLARLGLHGQEDEAT